MYITELLDSHAIYIVRTTLFAAWKEYANAGKHVRTLPQRMTIDCYVLSFLTIYQR